MTASMLRTQTTLLRVRLRCVPCIPMHAMNLRFLNYSANAGLNRTLFQKRGSWLGQTPSILLTPQTCSIKRLKRCCVTEASIKTLSSTEHIRLRPGMYIGRLGNGAHAEDGIYVLLKETIDNSIDEFTMGFGKRIEIELIERTLQLDHCQIVELGCGKADLTRLIATGGPGRSITAFEVDEIQFVPQTTTPIEGDDVAMFEKFLDMLNDLVATQGFSCYTPDDGTRCEKTWINDTYPVNDGRTLFWRDDVLIDTQYSNLAPTGYTASIIAAIFG